MGGLLRALEVTGGVAGSHTQAAPPGKQVPSRGPQAWHQLPLANTSSTCGEPCASQALGWGPVPGSPKRQDFCLWNGGRLKVRLWGPRAEPSRVQRSKKLRRASWRRGYGREWPQSAPCGSPQPKWLRPLGDNAVGVYPRLHSHQARSPSAGWRPATPDGPAPPTELQTAASRCLRPGTASLHHPGAPPGPRRGPSVGAWFSGSQGACVSRGGTRPSRGLRGGFLINHLASCVAQGQASPGAHPGREAPHHQCRGEVSGCPLPRSGASVNTPASATSAAPPPRGQSASCTSVPPPASRKELTQQSCLSPCSQTLTFVVSSPRPAPGPRMHRAAPSGG